MPAEPMEVSRGFSAVTPFFVAYTKIIIYVYKLIFLSFDNNGTLLHLELFVYLRLITGTLFL